MDITTGKELYSTYYLLLNKINGDDYKNQIDQLQTTADPVKQTAMKYIGRLLQLIDYKEQKLLEAGLGKSQYEGAVYKDDNGNDVTDRDVIDYIKTLKNSLNTNGMILFKPTTLEKITDTYNVKLTRYTDYFDAVIINRPRAIDNIRQTRERNVTITVKYVNVDGNMFLQHNGNKMDRDDGKDTSTITVKLRPGKSKQNFTIPTLNTNLADEIMVQEVEILALDNDDISKIYYYYGKRYAYRLSESIREKCYNKIKTLAGQAGISDKVDEINAIQNTCYGKLMDITTGKELYSTYYLLLNKINGDDYKNQIDQLKVVTVKKPQLKVKLDASATYDKFIVQLEKIIGKAQTQLLNILCTNVFANLDPESDDDIDEYIEYISEDIYKGCIEYFYDGIYYHQGEQKANTVIQKINNKDSNILKKLGLTMAGGKLVYDKYYMKYMKYKTKYLIKTGKTDNIIRKFLFKK
jgi:hypothetical protein